MSGGRGACRVVVAGDSMLDRFWEGSVDRISPEAPVPVLRLAREWQCAGGAANVAVNLATLDCPVTLATLLGEDEAGERVATLVSERGVALQAVRSAEMRTTQKIRAVCRRQQLLRMDFEQSAPVACAAALCDLVGDLIGDMSGSARWLLLTDYGKGALINCPALLRRAQARGCRVLIDPKGLDFERYRGAWLLKPNAAEAAQVAGAWSDEVDFALRMEHLRDALDLQHLLVTRGADGMSLFSAGRAVLRLPAEAAEVRDVSGAGDTALAALTASLAAGATVEDAARRANRAAGIAVGKFGTASVSVAELDGAAPAFAARPVPAAEPAWHDEAEPVA